MRNKRIGRDVIWATVAVLVGVAVLAVGVAVHNVYVAYVGLGIAALPLFFLWFR